MSPPRHLQTAAIRLCNCHLNLSPALPFVPPRSQFSTSTPPRIDRKNRTAKQVNLPSHGFSIPSSFSSLLEPDPLSSDSPPSSNTPPFLKIVMSRHSPPESQHHQPFRPDSAPTSGLKTLTGSTISSSEREVFAKIFDQMITQPISEERRKQRFLREKRVEPENLLTSSRKRVSISASVLDESLFLTPKEVDEYPAALRPLAARFAREDKVDGGEEAGEWGAIERRMDACKNDYEVSVFLDREVFSVMEAHAVGRRFPSDGMYSFDAIRANYAVILLKAMKLYRITYQNPLAAHTLFLRAKTLSAESYVLGCTVSLYNELLLSRWESFTDLFSISEILDEMSANGVNGDVHTMQILRRIQEDVEEWATQGPEVARALWVSEKERMGKLERAQKEIVSKMEENEMEEELQGEYSDELDKGIPSHQLPHGVSGEIPLLDR